MGMYVIQTTSGKEDHVINLINTYIDDSLIQECFQLKCEVKRRFHGEWKLVQVDLLPGYIFISTDDANRVYESLRQVPFFTRLLGNNDLFIPLSDVELSWLNKFSKKADRISHFSQGVIEGDKVVITSGPLVGCESSIVKIDRHKRIAYLDISMMGRLTRIQIGLEIIKKQ